MTNDPVRTPMPWQSRDAGDEQNSFLAQPLGTAEDAYDANFQLSQLDTPTMAIARSKAVDEAKAAGGSLVPPEALNEEFPGLPEPFKEPLNRRTAQLIYDTHMERAKLQARIEAGPQGFGHSVERFVGNTIAHLLDPIELGATVATMGAFRFFGIGASLVGQTGARAATARVGVSIAENAIGAAAVEPLVYQANKKEQVPYTVENAVENIAASVLAMEGIKIGAKGAAKGLEFGKGKWDAYRGRLNPVHDEVMTRTAVVQAIEGKHIDVAPTLQHTVKEATFDGNGRYTFTPIDPDTLPKRRLFTASERQMGGLESGTVKIGDDLGDGVYLTDNPHAANSLAARSLDPVDGTVHQVEVKDLNVFDLDEKLPVEHTDVFQRALDDAFEGRVGEVEGMTGKEVMELLNESPRFAEVSAKLNQELRARGFDAHKHSNSRMLGEEAPKQNVLMVFNPEKITEVGRAAADRELVPVPDPEASVRQIKDLQSQEKSLTYDQKAMNRFHELEATPEQKIKATELQAVEQEIMEELQALKEQNLLDEAAVKELDDLAELRKTEAQREKLFKAATFCVGRGA